SEANANMQAYGPVQNLDHTLWRLNGDPGPLGLDPDDPSDSPDVYRRDYEGSYTWVSRSEPIIDATATLFGFDRAGRTLFVSGSSAPMFVSGEPAEVASVLDDGVTVAAGANLG